MITYISVAEASARSSWSEDDLVYLCETSQILARRVGQEWYCASSELARLESPEIFQGLRQRLALARNETTNERRRARTHANTRLLTQALFGVMMTILVGALTTYSWSWLEKRPLVMELPDWSLPKISFELPEAESKSNLALVSVETGGLLTDLAFRIENFFRALPELLLLAQERVALNWRHFLGLEVASPNKTNQLAVNSSLLTNASSTDALASYINQQIESELTEILGQTRSSVISRGVSLQGGVVVVPSTGRASDDAAILEKLQDSFSDRVRVEIDSSGVGGVITPLFDQYSDDQYLFMLTPIRR